MWGCRREAYVIAAIPVLSFPAVKRYSLTTAVEDHNWGGGGGYDLVSYVIDNTNYLLLKLIYTIGLSLA